MTGTSRSLIPSAKDVSIERFGCVGGMAYLGGRVEQRLWMREGGSNRGGW